MKRAKRIQLLLMIGGVVSIAPLLYMITQGDKDHKRADRLQQMAHDKHSYRYKHLEDYKEATTDRDLSHNLLNMDGSKKKLKPSKQNQQEPDFIPNITSAYSKWNNSADLTTFAIYHTLDESTDLLRRNFEIPSKDFTKFLPDQLLPPLKQVQKLKVIAIAHSHNDPGWLKTVEDYFEDQTKHILDNMLTKLQEYPNMTFVWAESVFLSMWWETLNPSEKEVARQLINRKQFEIVSGSWVVPDEACTHFYTLIDQMIEGHQWLTHNIGVKPRISWSLDVFGYSSSLPFLYHEAQLDKMIILRVHSQVKKIMQDLKLLDFEWRQPWDNNGNFDMQTVMLPYRLYSMKHQCGPNERTCLKYDFRRFAGEPHEIGFQDVSSENIHSLAEGLYDQLVKKNDLYRHDVVLLPIGDDFRYDRIKEWDQQYINLQALFSYMSAQPSWNVEAKFGTVEEYFNLVNEEVAKRNLQVPTLQGDFFPYMDVNNNYWTGFYTTRPYSKKRSIELSILLRAAEITNTLVHSSVAPKHPHIESSNVTGKLAYARRALALFQHHDAITGTERHYTETNYGQKLLKAYGLASNILTSSLQILLNSKASSKLNSSLTPLVNSDFTNLFPSDNIVRHSQKLTLFNSLSHEHEFPVRLYVASFRVVVLDNYLKPVLAQINPVFHANNVSVSQDKFELVFLATVPAVGSTTFTLDFVGENTKELKSTVLAHMGYSNIDTSNVFAQQWFPLMAPRGDVYTFDNQFLRARFGVKSGMLQSLTIRSPLRTHAKFNIDLLTYKSRYSGAYVFYPTGPAVDSEMFTTPPVLVLKGPVVSEISVFQRKFAVTHTVRMYNSSLDLGRILEIRNIANVSTLDDKDLIMKFSTHIKSDKTFWTDSNGLNANRRQRFVNLPLGANYYPMTAFSFIEDSASRLSLLSAQPLGVSSQEDGSLEVMLDRRPLYDDGKGLGEGVRDNRPVHSLFYLLLEMKESELSNKSLQTKTPNHPEQESVMMRNMTLYSFLSAAAVFLQEKLYFHVHMFLSNEAPLTSNISFLRNPLPCDVQLVNFRLLTEGKSVRNKAALSLFRSQCDSSMRSLILQCDSAQPAVDLANIWGNMTANVFKASLTLLNTAEKPLKNNAAVMLKPMSIQTYLMQWQT